MKTLQSLLNIILLILCAGLFIYARHVSAINGRLSSRRAPLPQSSASPFALPTADTYTDYAGVQHTVITNPSATERIRREVGTVTKIIVDSLAMSVGVKAKDIDGFAVVKMQASRDSVRFLARSFDSLRRVARSYKDKYLTLLVRDPAADDSTDKGDFDFAYNADLRTVEYSQRKKFLGLHIGRRQYYTDISSSDPRLKIAGVEKLTLQRRVPALGFRLQALSSYNIDTRGQTLGLGVRFDLGDRFNTGINYTYSFLLRDWVPTIYAKYDLLQFGR